MLYITAALLAFVGSIAAQPSRSLQARDDLTITFYPQADFAGKPVVVSGVASNECQAVPAKIAGKVGSIRVSAGALCRITYSADTCTPHGDLMLFPDQPAAGADLHHFFDPNAGETIDAGAKITSFLCQTCSACPGA